MQRYFIYLAYDGANYHGWQIQPNGMTVQERLMKALSTFLLKPIEVIGAGRTDTGVHAELMVAHFEWDGSVLDVDKVADKLNRILPQDIVVFKVRRVKPDAHARFNATSRMYRYYITSQKSPFCRNYRYRIFSKLNIDKMNEAAKVLFDYTDFTSFSKLGSAAKTNVCKISHAQWVQIDDHTWMFEIRADRFLRNMVRAIVGTLIEIGRNKMSIEEFRQVIERKDRCEAGMSVPGNALFLVDVTYPDELFEV